MFSYLHFAFTITQSDGLNRKLAPEQDSNHGWSVSAWSGVFVVVVEVDAEEKIL